MSKRDKTRRGALTDDPDFRATAAALHVDAGMLARVREGVTPPEVVERMYLEHLLELCPESHRSWDLLTTDMQNALRTRLGESPRQGPPEQPVLEDASLEGESIEDLEREVALRRRQRSLVLHSLRRLLETPPKKRLRKVLRSRKRFKSVMMAELLMDECRRRVRNAPLEAAELAELIPHVVERIPGDHDAPWRVELSALGTALQANAVRVAGELPQADRLFAQIHHQLATSRVHDLAVRGEIASLEASLRIDQRSLLEAEKLLELAVVLYRLAGEPIAVARVLIQQASVQRWLGRLDNVLERLHQASEYLQGREEDEEYLYLCTVTARVNVLCEVEKFEEAGQVLEENRMRFALPGDRHQHAMLLFQQGQVALGLGRPAKAIGFFTQSRGEWVHIGRFYDVALAGLYEAQALLEVGNWQDLQALSLELVQAFRSSEVDREALAALALLARAAKGRQVTRDLLLSLVQRVRNLGC